ncbi:MAG TPA: tetratricopeptide repeat protein [Verrucomicrobiae bacterium]|nr:tetratricopeptide repeat protein [Verrucomicrobiae bacterium]
MLVTFLAYQPVWRAGFIWDDDVYITNNALLRAVNGLWGIWARPGATIQYYPLVFTSFWAEYHLWKLQPLGYHLVNVFLHALNAVLLWRVLRRLEIPGSWWAAAIFALHPVEVESVAWITERKNVLSGCFYFLAVLAYLRFRPLMDRETTRGWDWRYYPLVLVSFACAMLSKTATCSLPVALLLLVWWKTGRVERRDVLASAPMFVLGAVLGYVTIRVEKGVGAGGAEWALSFVQRGLVTGRALWFYAAKVFWPARLTFNYPRWEIDAGVWWEYAFPLAALTVLIALWRLRSRIGRGPLVAVLYFLVTLGPLLGFFDVYYFRYSFVADHFQYLACIGLITLAVATVSAVVRQSAGRYAVGLIVVAVLGMLSWRHGEAFHDEETLWGDTLTKNPRSWMAHTNLGYLFIRLGRLPDAIRENEEALRLNPGSPEAHYDLGVALAKAGRLPEAEAHWEQALRLRPNYAQAHNNLGGALLRQPGRLDEAIGHVKEALRLQPGNAEARDNLGVAFVRLGRVAEAKAQWEQALQLKPDDAEAHANLGNALKDEGRFEEAVAHYEQALRIEPDLAAAHYNLGLSLARLGRLQEAIGQYEQALRLKPDDPKAHRSLGNALAQTGRIPEAMGHWEQALRLKPDDPEIQNDLAWLLATLAPANGGDPARAVTLAERACELTNNRAAEYLDTLAVAYAGTGRFDDAIATAHKASGLARSEGQTRLADEIETRLELYRAGRAYRAPASGTSRREQ